MTTPRLVATHRRPRTLAGEILRAAGLGLVEGTSFAFAVAAVFTALVVIW